MLYLRPKYVESVYFIVYGDMGWQAISIGLRHRIGAHANIMYGRPQNVVGAFKLSPLRARLTFDRTRREIGQRSNECVGGEPGNEAT